MNVLTIADLHLTDASKDEYRHELMAALPAIVRKHKPDMFAILGDLTEEKDHHSARLVNRIAGHLKALADCAPTYVLMGNHDYHNEGHPFFAFIDMIPNLFWIGRVRAIKKCLFLPHTRTYEQDWDIEMSGYDWIFAHNTFEGATAGFGRELSGIPLNVFPKNARVIAGDIHVPQTIGQVTYVGAPYSVDFGDEYKPRMLSLSQGEQKSISLAKFPQKRIVDIQSAADLDAAAEVCCVKEGDIIEVRCAVDDMSTWHDTHKAILQWSAEQGMIAQRIKPVLTQKRVKKRHKISTEQDDVELIEQFAKRHTLTDHTLKVGKELL